MLIISKVSTTSETANWSEDVWRCDNNLHIINRSLVISNGPTRCLSSFKDSRISNPLYEAELIGQIFPQWWSIVNVLVSLFASLVCIVIQWGIPMIVTWKHGILHYKNVEMYAWIIPIYLIKMSYYSSKKISLNVNK